jgi:pre-mRNA-splicing factor ATP-dependent RNA helicase DHX15/PRP43
MADRRPEDLEMARAKRIKTGGDLDPTTNPYLAHMYNGNDDDSYANGYSGRNGNANGSGSDNSILKKFHRHKTTAEQANEAENGPNNPFNGVPLSQQYFSILKTRRDLPVHKQRFEPYPSYE